MIVLCFDTNYFIFKSAPQFGPCKESKCPQPKIKLDLDIIVIILLLLLYYQL